jgi:hypothetical protein
VHAVYILDSCMHVLVCFVFERMHACVEACGRSAGGAPCSHANSMDCSRLLPAASRGVWLRSGENSSASISSWFLASVMWQVILYVCSAGCNTAVSLSWQVIHLARVVRRVNTGDYVCVYFMFMPCMQTLHRFRRVCGTADNDFFSLAQNICLKCKYVSWCVSW